MIKSIYQKIVFLSFCLIFLMAGAEPVLAQLRPLSTQYYENQYISNPSFAGMDKGININLSYRNQWRAIPGSPVTMNASGDYRYEKVGLGFNAFKDKAGLISRTRITGMYAYHLPLNGENRQLHFGVALGVMREALDNPNIIAMPDDMVADRFSQRKGFIDGDLGMAYTTERVTLQAALPNLKKFFQKDEENTIDGSTYFAAASYKIGLNMDAVTMEPKISFRGAKDIDNIWDIGTNLKFENNILSFMGMYHSDKSSTFGVGVKYNRYTLQGFYTSQMAAQRQNTGGDFELSLKINLRDY